VDATPFDPAPRVLLFDLDDTLCDYETARAQRLRMAFSLGADGAPVERPGVDFEAMIADSIRTHPHAADHFVELFHRHGIDDPAAARAAIDWYRAHRYHGLRLFPDVADILRSLRTFSPTTGERARRRLGVVTNGPADVQRAKIAVLGVGDLVDFVVVSGEFGVAKPDPGIFRAALALAQAEPGDAVFVGDSPEFDIAGAQAAGLRNVWVNRGGRAWDPSCPAPTREIRNLRDLPRIVGDWRENEDGRAN
jgi:putative hydrolase of the HAD superfamily